jgi:Toprim domain/CHC2 zinc finger
VFTEDELAQARAVPVLKIAEDHDAKLKKSGRDHVGPCPACGGVDRFAVWPKENVWNCRGYGGGDAIALEMHLSGSSFVDAVRALIGQDAGTLTRRQPTAEEIAAREAREAQRRREEAADRARKEASAARIVAQLQPVAGTPGAAYLSDVRSIDTSHWAIRRALEDVGTLGWHPSIYFNQPDPKKPSHELNGQYLGAIVAVLTDPVTAERTGGITRTFIHQRSKVCRAMSLGGVGRLGIIRLSPDDEVSAGLHGCEGVESSLSAMQMGFCPMWAFGSTTTMEAFPVLPSIECFTIVADNDRKTPDEIAAGDKAARKVCQRWADAGREAVMKIPKRPGEDANDIIKRRARNA